MSKLTRRDFLSAVGAGAAMLAVGARLAPPGLAPIRTAVTKGGVGSDLGDLLYSPEQQGVAAYFMVKGAAPSVRKSELKVAGVHPDALEAKNTIKHNTDIAIAEPGCFEIDFVSPDTTAITVDGKSTTQGMVDQERLKSGVAVIAADARRDLDFEEAPVALFENGFTRITTGYGTFTVVDSEGNEVMSVEAKAAKKRGFTLYFRGRTDGGPEDDLNMSIVATGQNKPYTNATILPTDQQFVSEDQVKQTALSILGKGAQPTNCGAMKGCKEAVIIVVDVTKKAFTAVKTTDGKTFTEVGKGDTNIVVG